MQTGRHSLGATHTKQHPGGGFPKGPQPSLVETPGSFSRKENLIMVRQILNLVTISLLFFNCSSPKPSQDSYQASIAIRRISRDLEKNNELLLMGYQPVYGPEHFDSLIFADQLNRDTLLFLFAGVQKPDNACPRGFGK